MVPVIDYYQRLHHCSKTHEWLRMFGEKVLYSEEKKNLLLDKSFIEISFKE